MGTRSTISKQNTDGTVKTIYCHWDGYLSWNGRILLESYSTEEKVDELLSLGNISSLHSNINPNPEIKHDFDKPQDDVVVAYARDRGEKLIIQTLTSLEEIEREEFNYLFKDGKWFWSPNENKNWRELKLKDTEE